MTRDPLPATQVQPTAGNWSVERRTHGLVIVAPSRHRLAPSTMVATIFGHTPEAEANARLLVNAKAGLAHVKALAAELQSFGCHVCHDDPECPLAAALKWVAVAEGVES